MFYLLIAIVVGAGVFGVGFLFGRGRATDFDRTRRGQYKQAVEDLDEARRLLLVSTNKVRVYERGLNDIAAGRGIAEVTAAYALNEANN